MTTMEKKTHEKRSGCDHGTSAKGTINDYFKRGVGGRDTEIKVDIITKLRVGHAVVVAAARSSEWNDRQIKTYIFSELHFRVILRTRALIVYTRTEQTIVFIHVHVV